MQELISVIIPVYNVEPYLSDCLQSIAAQTYRNLEIILVDDGSTDASGRICEEWRSRDERIRVIHQPNAGVSAARNAGLRASTGAFIGFVDGDDWIEPELYETLAEALKNADMSACAFTKYPQGGQFGKRAVPRCGLEEALICIYEPRGYYTAIWNKLFRRSLVFPGDHGIEMDTALANGEDEVWLTEVIQNGQVFSFVPKTLYHWRVRPGSASREVFITDNHMSALAAKKLAIQKLPQEERLQAAVKASAFDDLFNMQVTAYCTDDFNHYQILRDTLEPMCRFSLKRAGWPRRLKILLLVCGMRMKLPKALILAAQNANRPKIKRSC